MAIPKYLEILKGEGVLAWKKFREQSGESKVLIQGDDARPGRQTVQGKDQQIVFN